MRIKSTILVGVLVVPQVAWGSDYSGLLPIYIGFVALIGGVVGAFEWMLINAVMDRGDQAQVTDPEAQNKSRFGCGLGVVLWIINSLIAHIVILTVWG